MNEKTLPAGTERLELSRTRLALGFDARATANLRNREYALTVGVVQYVLLILFDAADINVAFATISRAVGIGMRGEVNTRDRQRCLSPVDTKG